MARAFRILTLALATLLVAPSAALAIAGPATQRLPDARVGETSTTTLTYTTARPPADPGEAVTGVAITGPDAARFAVAEDRCTPHRVTASCTVAVRFQPAATGAATASLTVGGEDAPATTTLDAYGYVTGAVLVADQPAVDFGAGAPGAVSFARTITVRNAGDRAVTVTAVGVSGPGAGAFSVDADACVRLTLAPQATCGVDVRASAPASGEALAVLEVTGDDGATRPVTELRTAAAPPSPAPVGGGRPNPGFTAVACELGVVSVGGTRRVIRVRIYSSCRRRMRLAVYRGSRRLRAVQRSVPPGVAVVRISGRFRRGTYAIRVAALPPGQHLGDGQSFVVRR